MWNGETLAAGLGVVILLTAVAAVGQPTSQVAGPAQPDGLAISGWVDREQDRVGETVTVGILIRNPGPSPVFNVDVEWIPGTAFQAQQETLWSSLGPPPHSPAHTLAPGEAALVRTRLTARKPGGRAVPSVVVRWRRERGMSFSARAVTLPSVEIVGQWSWLPRLWPVVLPIGATLLVALLGWRFTLRVERQKEHLATFLTMQKKVLQVGESHYLPIGSAVRTLRDKLKELERADPAEKNGKKALSQAFAAFMLLHHRDFQLTHKVGGWLLLDRVGEEAVDALWECYREAVKERFNQVELGRMIQAIGKTPTLSSMIVRFERPEDPEDPDELATVQCWRDLRGAFETWVSKERAAFQDRMTVLGAFADVLHLEVNRFYAPLYGPKERFPGADEKAWIYRLRKTARALTKVAKEKEAASFGESAERLADYCDRIDPKHKPSRRWGSPLW